MDHQLRNMLANLSQMMATDMDTCIHTGCGMFPPSMPSFNPVNDAEVFNGFGTTYIWDVSSVNGSILSFNPVNDAEVFNGFGMQSHPNVENRSVGCNEGVVYEEALQKFYAAYQSRNKGRRSVSSGI
ncbi:uncharacterized protein LOC125546349 isoform X5 [Triticum urartu]|uniref:uncharacterized protein LOC125546349 isoform X5 n=1 Tax=Triticum urartu TaxID=4572 RepID=UPI0020445A08|nr:uncharacterized protein LOC125546349 isoform X5 [Triticum urartu]